MKCFSLVTLALAMRVAAQEAPTPLGRVPEGVYVSAPQRGAFATNTTILELKDGRFRHWVRKVDSSFGPGRTNSAAARATNSARSAVNIVLQSGEYATNAGTVTFVVRTDWSRRSTNRWTCVEYLGQTLLWTEVAQQRWEKEKRLAKGMFPSQVLFLTNQAPEQILDGK